VHIIKDNMLKDLPIEKQHVVIHRIFTEFERHYEESKFLDWRKENSVSEWALFLADASSLAVKDAIQACFEGDHKYELPSAAEFSALCGLEAVEIPKPAAAAVIDANASTQDADLTDALKDSPPGAMWAKKLWARQMQGEILPVDSIRMMNFALGIVERAA
jgi:hypothetical protein